ncbi:MAG: hypothetical protein ACLVL7_06785 [Anaerotruncus massiliensis (ex Togo et al. 2019)]
MELALSRGAAYVLCALRAAGYEAYVVGGCVRDSLLGRRPAMGCDHLRAAGGDESGVFRGARHRTGVRHGTVAVLVDGEPVEITTYRVDGPYSDGRRPARSPLPQPPGGPRPPRFHGERDGVVAGTGLVDPFGGRTTCAENRSAASGPRAAVSGAHCASCAPRFFVARLFHRGRPPPPCARTARAREGVGERIAAELVKLVCGAGAPASCGVPRWSRGSCPGGTATRTRSGVRRPIRRAAGDALSTEADAEAALRRLKFDRGTIRAAKALLAFRTAPLAEDRPAVRRMLRKLGPAAFRRLLAMRAAYGEPLAGVERTLGEVLEEGDCWSLDALAVKGGDLLAAGVPAGPELGRTLAALLDAVIDGRCPNERAALLNFVSPQ